MKIDNSFITLSGRHYENKVSTHYESMSFRFSSPSDRMEILRQPSDKIDISNHTASEKAGASNTVLFEPTPEDKQKIQLLEKLIYLLTGKKIKFHTLEIHGSEDGNSKNMQSATSNSTLQATNTVGWSFIYDYKETYSENEQLSFNASGVVTTKDGMKINININVNMSRSFYSEKAINIRAGDAAKDPLVINFDGLGAQLGQKNFVFDIDADGTADQLHQLMKGSGFLARDINGNGIIDDGRELFGPTTGDGFQELTQFDDDANGWIDENDDVFDKLRIWEIDSDGHHILTALGQKGIGAIYLGNLDLPFALKDSSNNLQGKIKSTGIMLKEDGTSGIVQQIDMVI